MTVGSFESGGFLSSDEETRDNFERTGLGRALDGRPYIVPSGTWTANGTKLSVSEGRGTDPKLVVKTNFSDVEASVDLGLGDALYIRYVDASNWIRVTQQQDYSQSSYACNPYACNPYACNPYACNPYSCNPYSCNPYACNPYSCNAYSCNCTTNYGTNTQSNIICDYATQSFYNYCDGPCNSCCTPACSGNIRSGSYNCGFVSGSCVTSYTCSTCYQTCYDTCYSTCYDTCYQTCYDTCYQTCYQTCYNNLYPTVVRLEKMVAGTLTLVTSVNLGSFYFGDNNRDTRAVRLRVIAKGTNIRVFTNHNISASPAINTTVADHRFARQHGVGRHGYGNQDTGSAIMDNLVLTNAK